MATVSGASKIAIILCLFLQASSIFSGDKRLFQNGSPLPLYKADKNLTLSFWGMFRAEMFGGENVSLLNRNNVTDKLWYMRHMLDWYTNAIYWYGDCEEAIAEFLFGIRNKSFWGNFASIAGTTETETKTLDAVSRPHKHYIPRQIFWMREAWLRLNVNRVFGLTFSNPQTFTLGAFPFELGRGISLGSAYAVGPELLGFYMDNAIDQYAFGANLSGAIIKGSLTYDIYCANLLNRCSTLSETNEKILGQQYGRRACPQRGFGVVNYLFAGRLQWTPINDFCGWGKLIFEPYWLFNNDPEQRVEFLADAYSKLGTLGMAGEYLHERFECGFDYAVNTGGQHVKGWDRNRVQEENRDGQFLFVNSHVSNQNKLKIVHVPGGQAQNVINTSNQEEAENGQQIGVLPDGVGIMTGSQTLINSKTRFRDPYTNIYEGWMFVADASWWIVPKKLQMAATVGVASGDDNPNEETKDTNYTGFIPLQEIYAGKRVKSAFLLGGSGKLRRYLNSPVSQQSPNRFSKTVSGFTNLVFVGSGLTYKDIYSNDRRLSVNPNIISYWQEHPVRRYDVVTRQDSSEFASTFLGTELDVFINYYPSNNLRLFFVGSIFCPGKHFDDIRGKPIDADQDKELDRFDETGYNKDLLPNIGDDKALTLNIGLEFNF